MEKKIVVIGGGPGGYAAAIKAAQLGGSVTLVEHAQVGGTCLNVGCIPTKTLLHTAEFYDKAVSNRVPGVTAQHVRLDWPAAQSHKEQVVAQLTGGVAALLRHNGVRVVEETARLMPDKRVQIGSEIVAADSVILATGSVSAALTVPGADLRGVIDSTGALALEAVPPSLVIVGGGVIGMEFAALFGALGTQVTVLEMQEEILPGQDREVSSYIRRACEDKGVAFVTGARLTRIDRGAAGLTVHYDRGAQVAQQVADQVLIAVGRRANTGGLGLEEAGVRAVRGTIQVDDCFQTTVPGIYAVGDCNGQSLLAHAAMAQGEAVAAHIMGQSQHYNKRIIPSCIYTAPEIASVGLTEQGAEALGVHYAVGRFHLSGNGKALIEDGGGFVKIIADKRLGEVLGVHMVGPRATELIAEAALCMTVEGTVDELVQTIHAHPTISEAVREAAMSVFGKPIHGI